MISVASWVVWLHLLGIAAWLGGAAVQRLVIVPAVGAESGMAGAARRAHFLTSRAMEAVIITGVLNLLLRGMGSDWVFSRGFTGMLTIKLVLVAVMVGLQVWMGQAWKREGGPVDVAVRRARAALTLQLLLGAAAVLLGLGVRSVLGGKDRRDRQGPRMRAFSSRGIRILSIPKPSGRLVRDQDPREVLRTGS